MHQLRHQLDIKHLRLIEAISERGNLSRAAKQLNLTQSALSHQLKNLEGYCDQALFHRRGKRMVSTLASQRILASSKHVLAELNSLASDLQALALGTAGRIKLSSECYTSYHWLPKVIGEFEEQFPKISVEVSMPVSAGLLEQLDEGKIDLAVMMYPGPESFRSFPLFQDELVVLTHPGNPLAKQDTVQASQLLDENLIVYSHGKNKLLNLLFGDTSERPTKITEMPLTEGILEWCSAGLGVAVMARWAATRYIDNCELVPLTLESTGIERTWYAITRDQELPTYLNSFVDLLSQTKPII